MELEIQFIKLSVDKIELKERYTTESILKEYVHLQIISDRFREISSYLLLATQIIYTSQITSDVFVGIRLMRLGDSLSAAFYAVDCTSAMVHWFFCLYWMGRLDIAMRNFGRALKSHFINRKTARNRHMNLRICKTFREIRVYLGPNPIRKGTAAQVIFELFNYYILAAMW